MTRYRILEVGGTEYTGTCSIPRFIVQEVLFEGVKGRYCHPVIETKDLKDFTSLDEARKYKRSLELKEGIVRE